MVIPVHSWATDSGGVSAMAAGGVLSGIAASVSRASAGGGQGQVRAMMVAVACSQWLVIRRPVAEAVPGWPGW
jgi:hypothetical protein